MTEFKIKYNFFEVFGRQEHPQPPINTHLESNQSVIIDLKSINNFFFNS